MIVPDINLLVYAFHKEDPRHTEALKWWENCLNGSDPVGLPWISMGGFIRIMTHPRILRQPMDVQTATGHVRSWIGCSQTIVLTPGTRFAALFLAYLDGNGSAGNLTSDAHLAALTVEHQAELHSNDADFSRFAGLRWVNPLAS